MAPLNEDQIGTLYRDNRDRILRYLVTLSGDETTAADLTQEVFARVHAGRENYRGDEERFLAWALIIARNAYYNHYRKEKRIVQEGDEKLDARPDNSRTPPADQVEKKIIRDAIRQAILCLPEPEKSVILYREIQGRTLEETAGLLGISVRTLSRKIVRATLLLKEELVRRGLEP